FAELSASCLSLDTELRRIAVWVDWQKRNRDSRTSAPTVPIIPAALERAKPVAPTTPRPSLPIYTQAPSQTPQNSNLRQSTPVEKPITVKGFDGRGGKAVTHILILHLSLDGCQQTNIPFCILDLGNHDIILGLKWMEYFDIWLNPCNRRLVWPDDESRLAPPSFHREIRTHRQALVQREGQTANQKDV